jgi:AGCS family alanine or glycine:cation symporter
MVAIVSVFIDTFLVLTMTAMVILTTGSINPVGVKLKGIQLTQYAFTNALGAFGNPFVAICLFFFAFSTIVGWYYFGETNIRFLFGSKGLTPYRILVTAFVFLGSLLSVDLVWELADLFNGIMVIPNVIALIGLSSVVSKTLKEYDDGLVKGLYK